MDNFRFIRGARIAQQLLAEEQLNELAPPLPDTVDDGEVDSNQDQSQSTPPDPASPKAAPVPTKTGKVTYAELERNTMNFVPPTEKRQWVVNPIQVTKMQLTPARESQTLIIKAEVNSNGKLYAPKMQYDQVIYEDGDQNDNASFTATDNEEYHIIPIDLKKAGVKVHCNCLDFYWRFSGQNHSAGSLDGNPPPAYQKTTNRPSVNPQGVPGVCKHLLKLAIQLKDVGIVT